eukprot:1078110-Pelagomonas_calceolata.AAC.2
MLVARHSVVACKQAADYSEDAGQAQLYSHCPTILNQAGCLVTLVEMPHSQRNEDIAPFEPLYADHLHLWKYFVLALMCACTTAIAGPGCSPALHLLACHVLDTSGLTPCPGAAGWLTSLGP